MNKLAALVILSASCAYAAPAVNTGNTYSALEKVGDDGTAAVASANFETSRMSSGLTIDSLGLSGGSAVKAEGVKSKNKFQVPQAGAAVKTEVPSPDSSAAVASASDEAAATDESDTNSHKKGLWGWLGAAAAAMGIGALLMGPIGLLVGAAAVGFAAVCVYGAGWDSGSSAPVSDGYDGHYGHHNGNYPYGYDGHAHGGYNNGYNNVNNGGSHNNGGNYGGHGNGGTSGGHSNGGTSGHSNGGMSGGNNNGGTSGGHGNGGTSGHSSGGTIGGSNGGSFGGHNGGSFGGQTGGTSSPRPTSGGRR